MRNCSKLLVGTLAVLVAADVTMAHLPTISDGSATDAEHAVRVSDVHVSRVWYHRVRENAPQIWLTFDIRAEQPLTVQLGVPYLGRLRDYRPALAVLGPGLPEPEVDLPFEVPDGLGALVLRTDDLVTPTVFDEPFTSTKSWILIDRNVKLLEAGTHYVVAYEPVGQKGKLWVALGKEEVFGLSEVLQLPDMVSEVRRFHEVPMGFGIPCVLLPVGALTITYLVAVGRRRRGT